MDYPRNFKECINDDGTINLDLLHLYSQYLDDADNELLFGEQEDPLDELFKKSNKGKKKRKQLFVPRKPSQVRHIDAATGKVKYVSPDPKSSPWYMTYVLSPESMSEREFKKFRLRFRLPYCQYQQLLQRISNPQDPWSTHFQRWQNRNAAGREPSPLSLLLLGTLRYIGRGFTFDDLEESTSISADVHRVFFHCFISFGSTMLYDEYVLAPTTEEEARSHMKEMEEAGFHGCVGSMDATNVKIEMCRMWLHHMHIGFKSSFTARTYNITVNHRRRILSSTSGHPARWNDKTIVRYDNFASGIKGGTILNDSVFHLFEKDTEGNIITVKYVGNWILVDNGYLCWSTTIPPMKDPSTYAELRWSQWAESMRKDVECTFGILKGRWRILKAGIRLHGTEAADKIWLTCCALHNLLLDHDGLDENWHQGVSSDWEREEGTLDPHDTEQHVPFAIRRLLCPENNNNFDISEMGRGNDYDEDGNVSDEDNEMDHNHVQIQDGCRVVRHLSRAYFRKKLIDHFDILYQSKSINWPSRRRVKTQFLDISK